jgi:hypothetical protein
MRRSPTATSDARERRAPRSHHVRSGVVTLKPNRASASPGDRALWCPSTPRRWGARRPRGTLTCRGESWSSGGSGSRCNVAAVRWLNAASGGSVRASARHRSSKTVDAGRSASHPARRRMPSNGVVRSRARRRFALTPFARASETVKARGGKTMRLGGIGVTRTLCPSKAEPVKVLHSAVHLPESAVSPGLDAADSGNSMHRPGSCCVARV